MKRLACVLGLAALFAAACGGHHHAPAHPKRVVARRPEPGPKAKAAAKAIGHAYELLTVESVMPGDPVALRDAAIEALAPRGWKAGKLAWTGKPARDAEVLRQAVLRLALRGELPHDAVLRATRAMTIAVGDTQTFALTRESVQALFAMIGGGPIVQPGILFHKLDDGRWAVSELFPNGAAERAGVRRGDILVTIDDTPIVHGYLDFAPLLGVPEGTQSRLVVERDGKNQEFDLRLVPVAPPIVQWRVLHGGIGYIRIWECTRSDDDKRDAGKLVAEALAAMDKRHVKRLVIDLRGNPGGYPFDVASLLVDADPLMLGIGSGGADLPVARTKVAPWKIKRPIAVIVDELTASGAEMIAFVLRIHAHAKIVGRPTAGGLTFPTTEKLADDVTISYPLSRVANPETRETLPDNRVLPDIDAPNPTAADYNAHKDPQLEAAIAAVRAMR